MGTYVMYSLVLYSESLLINENLKNVMESRVRIALYVAYNATIQET